MSSENKGSDQLCSTADLPLWFAYMQIVGFLMQRLQFSHYCSHCKHVCCGDCAFSMLEVPKSQSAHSAGA